MTRSTPPLDVDYARYAQLKSEGAGVVEACRLAVVDGKDFSFQIGMLRSVFGLGLPEARDIVAFVRYPARTERLFSYGTLQLESVQRAQFGRVLKGVADALVGFRPDMVEITDPDVLAKSGERFHPILQRSGDDADRVAGMVFLITPEELAAADAYEVSDYARVEAPLESGLRAWVYVKRA